MDKADRVRACYLHASLKWVMRSYLTNTSLRERFGIGPKNAAAASRLIKEAVAEGVIVSYDPAGPKKLMRYAPSWADPKKVGAGAGG